MNTTQQFSNLTNYYTGDNYQGYHNDDFPLNSYGNYDETYWYSNSQNYATFHQTFLNPINSNDSNNEVLYINYHKNPYSGIEMKANYNVVNSRLNHHNSYYGCTKNIKTPINKNHLTCKKENRKIRKFSIDKKQSVNEIKKEHTTNQCLQIFSPIDGKEIDVKKIAKDLSHVTDMVIDLETGDLIDSSTIDIDFPFGTESRYLIISRDNVRDSRNWCNTNVSDILLTSEINENEKLIVQTIPDTKSIGIDLRILESSNNKS